MLVTIKNNFFNNFTFETIVLFNPFLVLLNLDNLILDFILLGLLYIHECYMLKENKESHIAYRRYDVVTFDKDKPFDRSTLQIFVENPQIN